MLPFLDVPRPRFNPARLPGLAAWYDAADSNTVLTQVGGATNFVAASSQLLSIDSNPSIDPSGTGSFCFSFWFKRNETITLGPRWVLSKYSNADRSVFWNFENGTGTLRFAVSTNNVDFVFVDNSDYATNANGWNFALTWYDGTADKVYSQINNGTVRESAGTATSVRASSLPFTVGAGGGGVNAFVGDLDEITFHKRVLTADERTWLYNSGAGRTYAEAPASLKENLVSWWSMNAPASGDWLDQHGTNHLTPSASRPTATTGVTFNVAQDGQTVRRWLSRHNPAVYFDQSVLANQPTFTNATTGLTFNGTSSFMDGTSTMAGVFRNKGYGYIFAVARDTNPTGGSGGHAVLQINTPNGEAGRSALLTRRLDNDFTVIARRLDSDTAVILSGGGSNSNPNLLEYQMRWSAGTLQLFNNGISLVSGSYASSGNTSDTDSNKVAIGQDGGTLNFFPGNIREIIVCNEQLTDAQILNTRRYLQRKWGTPALP